MDAQHLVNTSAQSLPRDQRATLNDLLDALDAGTLAAASRNEWSYVHQVKAAGSMTVNVIIAAASIVSVQLPMEHRPSVKLTRAPRTDIYAFHIKWGVAISEET